MRVDNVEYTVIYQLLSTFINTKKNYRPVSRILFSDRSEPLSFI